jgi:hypothetical protein
MVPIVVFSCKGVLGSRALIIVAGERVFYVCVYIPIVAFEVGWPAEEIFLSGTGTWVLAGMPVLGGTSLEEVSIKRNYYWLISLLWLI